MMHDYVDAEWREALAANGLDSFEQLWPVAEDAWFEPPNHARGGWSGVTRQTLQMPDGSTAGIFVKRQENHTYRSWRHLFRRMPTLEREFRNCIIFRKLGIPSMEPLFYGERRVEGKLRAILVTRELEGYVSLDSDVLRASGQLTSSERKTLLASLAELVRKLHAQRFQHTCLYPKHLFARKYSDGSFEARFIDLEKTRRLLFRSQAINRDLDSLFRHTEGWRRTDLLRFYLGYRQETKLNPASKRLLRRLLRKSQR